MATPIIDNLVLPNNTLLVLLDEGSLTTGTIFRRSPMGGGIFKIGFGGVGNAEIDYGHVLFAKEMATEVEVDGIEYLAMHKNAVVGLIPD